jgi:copper transport protein
MSLHRAPNPASLRKGFWWRMLLVSLIACGFSVGTAARSGAHAQLATTAPEQGAKLASSPTEVSITFSENITPASAGIRVIDADTQRYDVGTTQGSGRVMTVDVKLLPPQAYVVIWQAVSSDGHPISGSYTFQVGDGDQGSVSGLGEKALASSSVNPLVQLLLRLARFGLFLSCGSIIAAAVWRLGGLPLASSRWTKGATWLAIITGVAGLLLDGAYVEGRSVGAIFDIDLATSSLSRVTVRALVGAAIVAAFLASALRRSTAEIHPLPSAQRVELTVAAVLVSVLLAASGHGAGGQQVVIAIAIVAVHVAAASAWVGGLALLATASRRQNRSDHSDGAVGAGLSRPLLLRWSKLAQVAVVALVCSGLANTWRQVGSSAALTSTLYGRILMAKLALVGSMLVFGAWHRRQVLHDSDRPIRRSVMTEIAVGLVVLSLSTWISSTVPAKAALKRPLSLRVATTSTKSEITISPAETGKNVIHLYTFDQEGRTTPVVDAAFVFTHIATGTKLEVATIPAGRGHQQALGVDFSFTGLWQVQTKIYLTDFDVENAESTVMIR